jgi:hypothetical protein
MILDNVVAVMYSHSNRPCYGEPIAISNPIGYAKFYSRSHCAVMRIYDDAGNMIETHQHAGEFKEWLIDEDFACAVSVAPILG